METIKFFGLFFLIHLSYVNCEFMLDNGKSCIAYQLGPRNDKNLEIKGILKYIDNLCDTTNDNYTGYILFTDYEKCSPKKKGVIESQTNNEALILKSSSIIEDVVWYTKNIVDEVNIPVVIILSNCNINSSDTNQISVLITDNNPFDEKIWI